MMKRARRVTIPWTRIESQNKSNMQAFKPFPLIKPPFGYRGKFEIECAHMLTSKSKDSMLVQPAQAVPIEEASWASPQSCMFEIKYTYPVKERRHSADQTRRLVATARQTNIKYPLRKL